MKCDKCGKPAAIGVFGSEKMYCSFDCVDAICADCGHSDADHFNAGERNVCGGSDAESDCQCDGFLSQPSEGGN